MSYSALATTPARECPYCGHHGGDIPYAGQFQSNTVGCTDNNTAKLHAGCYFLLREELAIFDTHTNHKGTMSKPLQFVRVRTEDTEPLQGGGEGYAIEDAQGNVLGYTQSLNGPEQRAAIAKVLEADESEIAYKGDDEDENGPVEVWGLKGAAAPVAA